MERESVQAVVRTTLVLMTRLAQRTRTQADDLMVSILRANEDRLVDAVVTLMESADRPPTDEQVAEALARVGIQA
jgi:hypothetical protein